MFQSVRRMLVSCAVAAALVVPGVAIAQTPPTAPQVVLSPEATEVLHAAIDGHLVNDLKLQFRPFFFPSFSGGTLCMFGFRMGKDGLMFGVDPFAAAAGDTAGPAPEVAKLELFGVLYRDGQEVARLGTAFQSAKGAGDAAFSGPHSFGDSLQPGSYELIWGVRDSVSGKAASRKDSFEVPNLMAGGLGTSSVMLVTGNPSPARGQFEPNTVYDGVRVLTISLPDNISHEFPASTSQVMLTYIVVGAQTDPATQRQSLQLTYRILNQDGKSIWRVAPQPLNRLTVGQPIPLSQVQGLNAGQEYRFEITVKDVLAGTETTTEVPFRITS